MITIRQILESDAAEWLRMRQALWPEHTHAEFDEEMASMLANTEREAVFVAEWSPGKLCGLVEVSIHDAARGCHTNHVGYLEGWYVDPVWRRQGVGRKLVEAAEAWARLHGCLEMASDTTSEYPISPQAHTQLGYQEVEREYYYRKDLS
jgi:aminoglycoside 6'-N-acetyltransferase I